MAPRPSRFGTTEPGGMGAPQQTHGRPTPIRLPRFPGPAGAQTPHHQRVDGDAQVRVPGRRAVVSAILAAEWVPGFSQFSCRACGASTHVCCPDSEH